jgi:hypothetical protein
MTTIQELRNLTKNHMPEELRTLLDGGENLTIFPQQEAFYRIEKIEQERQEMISLLGELDYHDEVKEFLDRLN